jgi:predicted dinucleotide-binding enzyme
MKIAVIGTGNVGGALATKWALAGHEIYLGVRNVSEFKGSALLLNKNTSAFTVQEAVKKGEVILLATPAEMTIPIVTSLGDTSNKLIIDAMNIVNGRGPQGYNNTAQAILDTTQSKAVIKCFNSTGFNNMMNPVYADIPLDMFMAGDNMSGKVITRELALDAGFAECYDIGGNDKFELLEKFAYFWINLAMFQGQGREIGFKLLKR